MTSRRAQEADYRNFVKAVERNQGSEGEQKVSSKERTIFHMTDTGDYLVEVKRYRYQAYVVNWVDEHPTARIYVRVKAKGLPVAWWMWDRYQTKFARLDTEVVDNLFTVLDSYK